MKLVIGASGFLGSHLTRELGWRPRPAPDVIREAARFFVEQQW